MTINMLNSNRLKTVIIFTIFNLQIVSSIELLIRNGHSYEGPVITKSNYGNTITLDAVMDSSYGQDFYLRSCIISNNPDPFLEASGMIIDANGCPTKENGIFAVDGPRIYESASRKHYYVYLRAPTAYAIAEYIQFTFKCQAVICIGKCTVPCGSNPVIPNTLRVDELTTRLTVPSAPYDYFDTQTQDPAVANAQVAKVLWIVGIVLGAFLLILLLLLLCFCCFKFCGRNRKGAENQTVRRDEFGVLELGDVQAVQYFTPDNTVSHRSSLASEHRASARRK